MEKKVFTKARILRDYQVQKTTFSKNPFWDEPKPMFTKSRQTFIRNNWNSGQDYLRPWWYKAWEHDGLVLDYDNPGEHYHLVVAPTLWDDDRALTFILEDIAASVVTTVHMKWYKERGCTDKIYYNDHLITLDEYVDFLNRLSRIDPYYKWE